MLPNYHDFLIKRFEQPDEVRTFEKGEIRNGEAQFGHGLTRMKHR
jgi:hypothetical protein